MEIAPYIALIIALLALLWFLMGVLHEAGHALAALLLLPGPITVHLGTYGQPTNNWHFRVGRLEVFLAYNVFLWRGGYCECPTNGTAAAWRQAAFIAAGPLLPVFLTGAGALISFAQPSYPLRALSVVLLAMAVIGLFINLVPRRQAVGLANGRQSYNDGQQLKNIRYRAQLRTRLNAQLQQAESYRQAGNYAASAELYLALLEQATPTYSLLGMAIHVLFQAGRYAEALALSSQQQQFAAEITDDNRFSHALLLSRTEQHPLALEAYTALLDQAQPYSLAYNNRGYTHNLLGNYELALADFDQAIALESEPAYAYNNRGLALLKLGQQAAGLADIRHGLALDPANAYGYRNLGIYHLDRREYVTALGYLTQAEQLDPTAHHLGAYMQQTRQHLEMASSAGGR